MLLRFLTVLASIGLHGGVVFALMAPPGERALEVMEQQEASLELGDGTDVLNIEQGISLEGLGRGMEEVSVEAVEAVPQLIKAVETLEPLKTVEDVQNVIGSETGPTQEDISLEPPPEDPVKPDEEEKVERKKPTEELIKEIKPQEVAMIDRPPIAALEEMVQAGQELKGGRDITALNAYRGKLYNRLAKKRVNPRSRKTGIAKVRFTVDPVTGELLTSEVIESSGSKKLDLAALKTIKRAAPFPPVPDTLGTEPLEFTVPFKYSVRKRKRRR